MLITGLFKISLITLWFGGSGFPAPAGHICEPVAQEQSSPNSEMPVKLELPKFSVLNDSMHVESLKN